MTNFTKLCTKCNMEQTYCNKLGLKRAISKNTICHNCQSKNQLGHLLSDETKYKMSQSKKGNKNALGYRHTDEAKQKISEHAIGFKGKQHTEEAKLKMREANKNKSVSIETRNKIRNTLKGQKKLPFTIEHKRKLSESAKRRTPISDETRKKLRLNRILQIEKDKSNGVQIFPSYNPDACGIIDEYGKENGYNFQHAMNGGEFYIKELGYWVDGYDKDKNTVLEYQEKVHKYKIDKDLKRKNEIVDFLKCEFIEIKEY